MEQILNLAQQLIQLHTTADNIGEINEAVLLVEKYLQQFSSKTFSIDGKPSLLIYNTNPDTKHFKIVLNAHLDVVQGEKIQFYPTIKDGRLYGRGTYDMKAAAAVMIVLFKEIAQQLKYPIALQITTDEETGSHGAKKQIDEGYRADFVISGECGNNFKITNTAKGVYHSKIIAHGVASHGAYPWKGENALMKLHEALNSIIKTYPLPQEEAFVTTVAITRVVTANEAHNRTPERAEAYLDIRFIPEDKDIVKHMRNLLPDDIDLEIIAHYSPLTTKEDNTYLQLLRKAGKEILLQDIELRKAHATSDVVRFAEAGCDGVEFGPIGANQHADDEWVDIKSLEDYFHILKQFLFSIK